VISVASRLRVLLCLCLTFCVLPVCSCTSPHRIGERGVAEIARSLSTNRSLTSLNLGANEIGPGGAAALSRALLLHTTMQSLNLKVMGSTLSKCSNRSRSILILTSTLCTWIAPTTTCLFHSLHLDRPNHHLSLPLSALGPNLQANNIAEDGAFSIAGESTAPSVPVF
jgi:hypothetical protein